jgi:hypothetical protein
MVDRSNRQKDTQEFFTPKHLVEQMLIEYPFSDATPFIESSVGNGNIAEEFYDYQKLKFKDISKVKGKDFVHGIILRDMWLADLQEDNCLETIKRLESKNGNSDPSIEILSGDLIPKELQTEGLLGVYNVDGFLYQVFQADTTVFNWWRPKKMTNNYDMLFEYDDSITILRAEQILALLRKRQREFDENKNETGLTENE